MGVEICRALDYAHRRAHIVHRDVTPRNVLIDDEGAVRLIDFGIAAPVTRSDDSARTEVFGSPGHMPPEQLHGAELTPATDVFAVGVLLIEAWTGYPPFRRATAQESEHALFAVPAPLEHEHSALAPLSALIASSIALDARQRPAAAEQLARPLREFLKREDSGDIARRLGERVRRARRGARSSNPWLERAGPAVEVKTRPLATEFEPHAAKRPSSRAPSAAPVDPDLCRARRSGGVDTPFVERAVRRSAAHREGPSEPAHWLEARVERRSRARGVGLDLGRFARFVGIAFAFAPRPGQATKLVVASSSALPTPPVLQTSLASSVAASPPVEPTSAPSSPRLAVPHSSDANHARAPAVPPSAEPDQFGELKLTADPRALVEVSGPRFQRTGQSPIVGLRVPVGRYQVVFRNETWGTPLTTQVMVVAGVSRSVHADFRVTEPAISVR